MNYGKESIKRKELLVGALKSRAEVYTHNIGNVYSAMGKLDKSLDYFEKALLLFKQVGHKQAQGIVFCNIGNTYFDKGNFALAFQYYEKYLSLAQQLGFKWGIGGAYHHIALVYQAKNRFNKALNFLKKSLAVYENIDDIRWIGNNCKLIGNIYYNKGKLNIAKNISSNMRLLQKNYRIKIASLNMAKVYKTSGEFQKAREYFKNAIKKLLKIGDKSA